MRIQQLDLIAFGPFSGHSLDLSQGQEGLHIVYGANEAGKSSTLRAVTQLLYGIPIRSKDNFIHAHGDMRIGAVLHDNGKTLEITRRKGNTNTLRDFNDDATIPEETLREFLGSLDKQTFETVFGLHHDELVKGGKMILEGEGNVGQALFAAAAGLDDLRRVSESLNEDAAEFFKAKGKNQRINAALRDLKDARKKQKESQLKPEEWSRAFKSLEAATERRASIEVEFKKDATRVEHLKRVQSALPLIAKRVELLEVLEPVADAILLRTDFGENLRTLLLTQDQLGVARDEGAKSIEKLESTISELVINERLFDKEQIIEKLKDRSASNSTALTDLRETLQTQLSALENDECNILQELNADVELVEAHELRLPPGLRERIEEIGSARDTLENRCKDAQSTLEKLRIRCTQNESTLENLDLPSDPAELDQTIGRAREHGKLEEQLEESESEYALVESTLNAELSRLNLWSGSTGELENLAVPSEKTVERFVSEFEKQDRKTQTVAERIGELKAEIRDDEVKKDELIHGGHVPSEEELEKNRKTRDLGWKFVRSAWESSTGPVDAVSEEVEKFLNEAEVSTESSNNLADAYRELSLDADKTADGLRREAGRVAELANLRNIEERHKEKLESLSEEMSELEDSRNALFEEWRALWKSCGIEPNPPKEMIGWIQRKDSLVDEMKEMRLKSTRVSRIRSNIDNCKRELSVSLKVVGAQEVKDGESLAGAIDRSEGLLQKVRDERSRYARLKEDLELLDAEQIPEAETAVKTSSEALDSWKKDWSECMQKLGTQGNTLLREASSIIRQLDLLFSTIDKIAGLSERIDQIRSNDEEFRRLVSELAKDVAPKLDSSNSEQAILELYRQLRKDIENSSRLEELTNQLENEKTRFSGAESTLKTVENDLNALCREAKVDDVGKLSGCEERSNERRNVESRLSEVEDKLISLSPGVGLEDFLESVATEDPDEVAPSVAQLEQTASEHTLEREKMSEEIGQLTIRLEQMDGSVEAAEAASEVQSLLAEIRIDTGEYVRLKVAGQILEWAIERYREHNQGPILSRAGKIFSNLTAGSFQDLKTDFGEKGADILVGVRSDTGKLVEVSGMSDGTADQLYLALRLASLEQYLDRNQAIPLILDDILINFDDERASATLKVLAEISDRTQVIFFTHHKHLVDIAKTSVDEDCLFVHTLAQETARGALPT